MPTNIDHIVIGATNLEQGAEFIEKTFGVAMPRGGEHPLMGTHNLLMQLSDRTFIEVIAINPDLPPPARPRWYGLDDPYVYNIVSHAPRLLTWVVNTNNISALVEKSSFNFGDPTPVTRGNLSWSFAIPDDGRLLAGGVLPYVMQWHVSPHPAALMPDLNCELQSIEVSHPYSSWISGILSDIDAQELVKVKPLMANTSPELKVMFNTPNGEVTLSNLG
ncbi:MAG: VOC family protein [Acidiferrobacterales bacterium]|nr:VOC family protein [Acidiferrobacterales bacterium]